MLRLFLLFVAVCLSAVTFAKENQEPTLKAPDAFSTPQITLKKQIFPKATYFEWLEEVKSQNQKQVNRIDMFQKSISAVEYDEMQEIAESYWIEYKSDGLKISGAYLFPKEMGKNKAPVVIYNRGGNPRHTLRNGALLKLALPFLRQGYIFLASNYRGSKFSEGKDEFGGKDLNDVLRLLDIAKSIPAADSSNIAMMGWSRGTLMTLLAMRENKQDIKAAILVSVISDSFELIKKRPNMAKLMGQLVPSFNENREQELRKRSPRLWANELNPEVPILILHGSYDWRTEIKQAEMLSEALQESEHSHKLVIYEKGDHSLAHYKSEWQKEAVDWLRLHLN